MAVHGPSFPKLSVVCGFCRTSFHLPDTLYQAYYNGQLTFYCDGACKFEHTKVKALQRLEKDYVSTSVEEKRRLKCAAMLSRTKELIDFRTKNVVTIKEKVKWQKVSKHSIDRSDEMVKLRLAGGTLESIGKRYGVTKERVRQLLKSRGCTYVLPKKPKKPNKIHDLKCDRCGKDFQRPHKARYCSFDCRNTNSVSSKKKFKKLVCAGCGCDFERSEYLVNVNMHTKIKRGYDTNTVYCTHKCYVIYGNVGGRGKKRVSV